MGVILGNAVSDVLTEKKRPSFEVVYKGKKRGEEKQQLLQLKMKYSRTDLDDKIVNRLSSLTDY